MNDYEFWSGFGQEIHSTKTSRNPKLREALFSQFSMQIVSGVHWYFQEACSALKQRLYLASSLAFINAIEASLRVSSAWLHPEEIDISKIDNFGNKLLRKAAENYKLPIEMLRLQPDENILEIIKTNEKPIIVQIRNHICHGNTSYFNRRFGKMNAFLPVFLKDTTFELADVSGRWMQALLPAIVQRQRDLGEEVDFEIEKILMLNDL